MSLKNHRIRDFLAEMERSRHHITHQFRHHHKALISHVVAIQCRRSLFWTHSLIDSDEKSVMKKMKKIVRKKHVPRFLTPLSRASNAVNYVVGLMC